jgi:hypothetical protein
MAKVSVEADLTEVNGFPAGEELRALRGPGSTLQPSEGGGGHSCFCYGVAGEAPPH